MADGMRIANGRCANLESACRRGEEQWGEGRDNEGGLNEDRELSDRLSFGSISESASTSLLFTDIQSQDLYQNSFLINRVMSSDLTAGSEVMIQGLEVAA